MSSLLRSRNSRPATLFNSPPKTRWSNCFAGCCGVSDMKFAPRRMALRKREAFIPKKFSKSRVPVQSGREQYPMPRHRTIIDDATASDRGEHATGFVHQKVGSRKVPVVTVGTSDCDIACAIRDLSQSQRQ